MKAYALCSIEANADQANWLGQQIGFVTFATTPEGTLCDLEFLLHAGASGVGTTEIEAFISAFDALPQYRHAALAAVLEHPDYPKTDWQHACGAAGIAVLPATKGA